jgi:hypothetical protein
MSILLGCDLVISLMSAIDAKWWSDHIDWKKQHHLKSIPTSVCLFPSVELSLDQVEELSPEIEAWFDRMGLGEGLYDYHEGVYFFVGEVPEKDTDAEQKHLATVTIRQINSDPPVFGANKIKFWADHDPVR